MEKPKRIFMVIQQTSDGLSAEPFERFVDTLERFEYLLDQWDCKFTEDNKKEDCIIRGIYEDDEKSMEIVTGILQ